MLFRGEARSYRKKCNLASSVHGNTGVRLTLPGSAALRFSVTSASLDFHELQKDSAFPLPVFQANKHRNQVNDNRHHVRCDHRHVVAPDTVDDP